MRLALLEHLLIFGTSCHHHRSKSLKLHLKCLGQHPAGKHLLKISFAVTFTYRGGVFLRTAWKTTTGIKCFLHVVLVLVLSKLFAMNDNVLKMLAPDFISKLSSMELRARLIVEGFLVGMHRSPYHGFSVEFAEHRPYFPGDDISNIDWKVFGRSDRLYIRQYEEETNLKAYILIDASGSMGFRRSGRITKLEYASYLAAGLIYLMMKQQDAVGLAIYDENIRRFFEPHLTYSYMKLLLTELSDIDANSKTSTATALSSLAERIKRRGLIIVISDFFDETKNVVTALKHFRHRKNEVIAFHVLDEAEINLDFPADTVFADLETGERVPTQVSALKSGYKRTMDNFIREMKRKCFENDIDYSLLTTSTSFDKALSSYLMRRKKAF
jgi:uncharacterized protein (DUF58 family)